MSEKRRAKEQRRRRRRRAEPGRATRLAPADRLSVPWARTDDPRLTNDHQWILVVLDGDIYAAQAHDEELPALDGGWRPASHFVHYLGMPTLTVARALGDLRAWGYLERAPGDVAAYRLAPGMARRDPLVHGVA